MRLPTLMDSTDMALKSIEEKMMTNSTEMKAFMTNIMALIGESVRSSHQD